MPRTLTFVFLVVLLGTVAAPARSEVPFYVVVVSQATRADESWAAVVDALLARHKERLPQVVEYAARPSEALSKLQQWHPRHTCFVARPEEATRAFVAEVHQLTRQYDDDPFTDTFWGILTGFDAANALAIARHADPLVVRKVASGTELALEMVAEGDWYCELVQNKWVRKKPRGKPETLSGPDDTTRALVDALNEYRADLFVTSGHATEREWQIGYRYRNGYFRSKAGQLYGEDTAGKRFDVESPNPKVYLPVGNCLMGHIDGPDAMALAWMNSAGVKQMVGYTVPTWFGFAGWGCLDYFVEQPGRYTLTEAFFANHHALVHALVQETGNLRGLRFDRDVVAFYGDPAWEARMAAGPLAYEQALTIEGDAYTLTITPNRGQSSFEPINTNGSQRGWRPIVQFLPHRVRNVRLVQGEELHPVVADDFILVPNPRSCDPSRVYRVAFEAARATADSRRVSGP